MEHDMPDLISYREVRAKIGSALDNCGYLDQKSFKAAIVLVVEKALAAGVTVDELQEDVRLATYNLEDELEALRGERRKLRRELEDLKYQRETKAQAYAPSGLAAPGESCVCNVPGCPEGPTYDLMNKSITRDQSK